MAQGWIKVDEELPDHNKTRRLMKLLDIDNDKAVGLVVKLWLFTFRVAIATGDLEPWGDDGIAEGIRWKGDPHKLVEALRNCGKTIGDGSRGSGFLEGYIVHDFSPRMRSVVYDRQRQQARREGKPASTARPAPPAAAVLDPAGAEEIRKLWHEFAQTHGLATDVHDNTRIPAMLTPEVFRQILTAAADQRYLFGDGKDGWKMTLGWLLKTENRAKVLGRQYVTNPGKPEAEAASGEKVVKEYRKRTDEILAGRNGGKKAAA